MKKLIINADDFGFSEAVNYGILKGFQEGVLTSTSVMANMPAFQHAIALAKLHPEMKVGVHLNLTCYKPLLETHKTLVKEDGYFKNQSKIEEYDEQEMYDELKAQIERVLASGVQIDHFDSHHHIHTTMKLKTVIKRLLDEYPYPIRGGFVYDTKVRQSELIMAFYDEGITKENMIHIIKGLKEDKVYDLMCHPAYVDKFLTTLTSYAIKRIDELDILCCSEVKEMIQKEGIDLTTYASVK